MHTPPVLHVCAPVCRGQRSTSKCFPHSLSFRFFDRTPQGTCSSQLAVSASPALLCTRITGMCCHAQFLLGCEESNPGLHGRHFYQLAISSDTLPHKQSFDPQLSLESMRNPKHNPHIAQGREPPGAPDTVP